MQNKAYFAFTLAEVLLTLIIIGVIASLTVPALMTNIQDAQFKTAWKKAFSDLSQATIKLTMDQGGNLANIYDSICTDDYCSANEFKNDLLNYLSFARTCNFGRASADNCWYSSFKYLGSSAGSFTNLNSSSYASGILNNGILLIIRLRRDGTGYYLVDVNGPQPPNTAGKDVFYPNINPDGKLSPIANTGSNICDPSNTSTTGYGCSSLYLRQ